MKRRCERSRARSKGRRIKCLLDNCLVASVSQKYRLFGETQEQLRTHGLSKHKAALALSANTTVTLEDVWLEAFWCPECEETRWYRVHKLGREYRLSTVPDQLWKQSAGTVDPTRGNPSVSEFTQKQAKLLTNRRTDGRELFAL